MCMPKQRGPGTVEPEEMEALSGQCLTTQDPRFVATQPRKKNMNLRIRKARA
jgi:hypothetical protein